MLEALDNRKHIGGTSQVHSSPVGWNPQVSHILRHGESVLAGG